MSATASLPPPMAPASLSHVTDVSAAASARPAVVGSAAVAHEFGGQAEIPAVSSSEVRLPAAAAARSIRNKVCCSCTFKSVDVREYRCWTVKQRHGLATIPPPLTSNSVSHGETSEIMEAPAAAEGAPGAGSMATEEGKTTSATDELGGDTFLAAAASTGDRGTQGNSAGMGLSVGGRGRPVPNDQPATTLAKGNLGEGAANRTHTTQSLGSAAKDRTGNDQVKDMRVVASLSAAERKMGQRVKRECIHAALRRPSFDVMLAIVVILLSLLVAWVGETVSVSLNQCTLGVEFYGTRDVERVETAPEHSGQRGQRNGALFMEEGSARERPIHEWPFPSFQIGLWSSSDLVVWLCKKSLDCASPVGDLLTSAVPLAVAWLSFRGAFFLYNYWSGVAEESVVVIRDLGIQLTRRYNSGKETHQFIDRTKIRDIIVNEGITMYEVIYYLAVVVDCDDEDHEKVSATRSSHYQTSFKKGFASARKHSTSPMAAAPLGSGGNSQRRPSIPAGGVSASRPSRATSKSGVSMYAGRGRGRRSSSAASSASMASALACGGGDHGSGSDSKGAKRGRRRTDSDNGGRRVAVRNRPKVMEGVGGKQTLVVIFEHHKPNLAGILTVYYGLRRVLFGEAEPPGRVRVSGNQIVFDS